MPRGPLASSRGIANVCTAPLLPAAQGPLDDPLTELLGACPKAKVSTRLLFALHLGCPMGYTRHHLTAEFSPAMAMLRAVWNLFKRWFAPRRDIYPRD